MVNTFYTKDQAISARRILFSIMRHVQFDPTLSDAEWDMLITIFEDARLEIMSKTI